MTEEAEPRLTDSEEIWSALRTAIGGLAVLDVLTMIIVSEAMEDASWQGMSVSVWAIVVGVPIFALLSALTLFGDRIILRNQR
ncbi:MAG: hypothetical protein CMB38_02505 [Euryarchaeota archaeon]|nr:hypothetical protein [Euryarchaeota archaeon]DAC32325.1 MAG TPA: hypothetical protein D7I05_08295 [Candidatus Poseidoniales archaeon]|tara:strand:- start:7609 stop:7857 length:249 start_codon:yes stop_codon:yes gene_type:complete